MWSALPGSAAWRFVDAVDGFEVLFCGRGVLRGHTSAVEAGAAYAVRYEIEVDGRLRTRTARVSSETLDGARSTTLASDGEGRWTVDGVPADHLDGLLDVDLEASVCTNTLPVHRLELPEGDWVEAPAVFVRALDLSVERLDQRYRRRSEREFDYRAAGDFEAVLAYDASGLIVDYPGIARRAL